MLEVVREFREISVFDIRRLKEQIAERNNLLGDLFVEYMYYDTIKDSYINLIGTRKLHINYIRISVKHMQYAFFDITQLDI